MIAHRVCGISTIRNTQNGTGCGLKEPDLVELLQTEAVRIWMTGGLFPHQLLNERKISTWNFNGELDTYLNAFV